MTITTDELRPLELLEGLPEEVLSWLTDHATKIQLAAGDRMFTRGQPADFMFIVVAGTIQRYEEVGGQWLVVSTTRAGQVTGMLPFSRMTHYPGHTVAGEASTVLRVNKDDFNEMIAVSHELGKRLVAEMSNRVRGDVRLEQQREKMIALGRLSAGLAHELNNPAAAIRRTSGNLSEALKRLSTLMPVLASHDMTGAAVAAMEQLEQAPHEREAPHNLSVVARSDREDAMAAWLEERDITDAWDLAGVFTDTGLLLADLETFSEAIPEDLLDIALTWVSSYLEVDRMINEIIASSERVSELVASVKTYSHMDRSSEHKPTDVREGIDNTLTMLGHKLKQKNVRLTRNYQDDLPTIPANAGELNQVWTNLIDNALDAMQEDGQLTIEVGSDDWGVAVKIIDDGEGIPESIRHRIFDPFFTTKDVGDGTGLGLDIVRRIINLNGGQIEVQSKPGRTEMHVRLPCATKKHTG